MYQDKYRHYLEQIPGDIEKCFRTGRRHVFGYTSNYDVVLKWDPGVYNDILERFLTEAPAAEPGDTIGSMEDFARISASCVTRGIGANFDITDFAVCDYLLASFETERALGGTGAQGAAALKTLGFPISVHLTDSCVSVCGMLDGKGVESVGAQGPIPIAQAASDVAPVYHMILQFSKGDIIRIGGREHVIPVSNRLILFYDQIHKSVPLNEYFLDYWSEHAADISSYLISGFDAIIDPEIMRERLKRLVPHYRVMKEKNPGMKLYCEGAYYMNPQVKEILFEAAGPLADIVGTNEEELAAQNAMFNVTTSVTDMASVIEGLEAFMARYEIKGVILHTKDYSMYYGAAMPGTDIEKGLTMGNLMAGARAIRGRYGTYEDCERVLEYPLSEAGLAFYESLRELAPEKRAVLVPSRYIDHPKYTIGLGDTFVSGVHTCFE